MASMDQLMNPREPVQSLLDEGAPIERRALEDFVSVARKETRNLRRRLRAREAASRLEVRAQQAATNLVQRGIQLYCEQTQTPGDYPVFVEWLRQSVKKVVVSAFEDRNRNPLVTDLLQISFLVGDQVERAIAEAAVTVHYESSGPMVLAGVSGEATAANSGIPKQTGGRAAIDGNRDNPSAVRSQRLKATVTSDHAARWMEAYMESKGIGQTEFAVQVGTTDRTLRAFRKTGKVRRDIFDAIAHAMGTTREVLLKPE